MKAMRGRIALEKHCVRKHTILKVSFVLALGVRTRPRVALC